MGRKLKPMPPAAILIRVMTLSLRLRPFVVIIVIARKSSTQNTMRGYIVVLSGRDKGRRRRPFREDRHCSIVVSRAAECFGDAFGCIGATVAAPLDLQCRTEGRILQ